MTDDCRLSVIVPAFDEEGDLPRTIPPILDAARAIASDAEVLVVDDGSRDKTAAIAARLLEDGGRVIALGRNRGKGAAVKAGMLAARGRVRVFLDADLSVDPGYISAAVGAVDGGADVAITSRRLESSRLVRRQPRHRELMGAVYRNMASWLLVPGISDFTCGLKAFSAPAAVALFSRSRVPRFGFDVEILYLARMLRLDVRELPVAWADDPDTRVRLRIDAARSFLELLAIPRHRALGRYRL